jgi:hypothetical protein
LVERNLAKVEVESSRLFSRSNSKGQHVKMLSFFFGATVITLWHAWKTRQGAVAKRLCSGLQIHPGRFDSAPRLQIMLVEFWLFRPRQSM